MLRPKKISSLSTKNNLMNLFIITILALTLSILINIENLDQVNAQINTTGQIEIENIPFQPPIVEGGSITSVLSSEILNIPFESCIIDPFSKAFSSKAGYYISGEGGKISYPRTDGNYTIGEYVSIYINTEDLDRVSAKIDLRDLSVSSTPVKIKTYCENIKIFDTGSWNYADRNDLFPKVSKMAKGINPPFNSCSKDSKIEYVIDGKRGDIDNPVATIKNPNTITFNMEMNSDFINGKLGGIYLSLNDGHGYLSGNFDITSIRTICKY